MESANDGHLTITESRTGAMLRNPGGMIIAVAEILILICTATFSFAQDWPQWRGSDRDGRLEGFNLPMEWPGELTLVWKVAVGAGDATPALVGDKLYVFVQQGTDEVLMCLDANNGKELWQDRYILQSEGGIYNDPFSFQHPGPRSSPTVADNKIVTLGVNGILSCLDAITGRLLWRKDEFTRVPRFFTALSPVVVDGMCIAHLGGKENGTIIAFELATGIALWKWEGVGPSYASPVIMTVEGKKQIVVQTEKSLIGLDVADGTLLWQVSAQVKSGSFYNAATPVIDGQRVIFTGQGQGTQSLRIDKNGDDFTARELWNNEEHGTLYSTPVLKDGLLYGLSSRRCFFCINVRTGQTVWSDTKRNDVFGAILDAGPVMLCLISKSELIAFTPWGEQYQELARITVSDSPTYAHPVIRGNRIYIKDKEFSTLWTIHYT